MSEFIYVLLTYSGTAIGIVLIALGWLLKLIIADKSKLLGWIVFIIFAILGGFCFVARNVLFTESMGLNQ